MPADASVRPPLLSEWEIERVRAFRGTHRRDLWLAGRALAKALVREYLSFSGVIEIRDTPDGEYRIYRGGLPMTDVWLDIGVRYGRVAAVIADRPVAVDVRQVTGDRVHLSDRVARRSEIRTLRRVFQDFAISCSVAWAVKDASLRAARVPSTESLSTVRLNGDLSVSVHGSQLQALAVRVLDDTVIAVVVGTQGRTHVATRIVYDDPSQIEAARSAAAVHRAHAVTERLTEARSRWSRMRWQAG